MRHREDSDAHLKQFTTFASKVANLGEDQWSRLGASCAELNSTSFEALLLRARLSAASHSVHFADSPKRPLIADAIMATGTAFVGAATFAYEIVREFAPDPEPLSATKSATGNPQIDAYLDAYFEIERALASRARSEPGTVTAVRAAGHVVRWHSLVGALAFDRVYRYVEPIIPFASLTSQA